MGFLNYQLFHACYKMIFPPVCRYEGRTLGQYPDVTETSGKNNQIAVLVSQARGITR